MLAMICLTKSEWQDWLAYCDEHAVEPYEEIRRVMKEEMFR